jgi:tripartite-type tricarboxylate transporter receptor subunit TctC
MISRRNVVGSLAALAVSAGLPRQAFGQSEPFYDGRKAIELIIPTNAAAGGDVAARYIAPFLSAHVAGNPPITPVNIAGGGAMLGANQFVLRRHDGYNMVTAVSSMWTSGLLGNEAAQYELKDLVPIIGVTGNSILSIAPSTGYTTPMDLLSPAEPLVMGANDPGGGHIRFVLALELLKIADSIQFVFGYEGGGATRIAYEQGEINLCSQTLPAYLQSMRPLEEEGKSIPLFQLGILDETDDLARDPSLPDIPTVREIYVQMYGEEPSGVLYDAVKIFSGVVNMMQIALMVHRDTPAEAIAALQAGAEGVAGDPEFMANLVEATGSDVVIVGEAARRMRDRLENLPMEPLLFTRRLATEKYGATGLRF